jgi:NitT/TauT family transport system permease protein
MTHPASPGERPANTTGVAAFRRVLKLFGSHSGTTLLYFIAILLCLIGAWEGFKFLGQETDYELKIGSTRIGLNTARDLTMPHLSTIAEALFKPAQRQGDPLIEVLVKSASFTLRQALIGFTLGTLIGLILAIIFAHSRLLQRGLMPYVVASQTVPILALAPMVIIWADRIGSREMGLPVIAAYLTFFPVTIYTLRGLSDVPATALELMSSYAASRRQILWKLRIPNALPYLFTALKITAPASVVGTIIGELPTGIQDGLGGAILNFAQYYTNGPQRLWATNLVTALAGIFFFLVVALLEWLVIRWKRPYGPIDAGLDALFGLPGKLWYRLRFRTAPDAAQTPA